MERFAIGDVVVALFPFSNLKGNKLRPALILANAEFGNFIICQITSKSYSSKTAIKLASTDFSQGKLPITSYIRPDKLFTIESSIIKNVSGKLTKEKKHNVLKAIQKIFSS